MNIEQLSLYLNVVSIHRSGGSCLACLFEKLLGPLVSLMHLPLQVHLRYQIEDIPSKLKGCNVVVSFGMAWQKSTKHQKRMTKNILKNLQDRLKVTFGLVENESAAR